MNDRDSRTAGAWACCGRATTLRDFSLRMPSRISHAGFPGWTRCRHAWEALSLPKRQLSLRFATALQDDSADPHEQCLFGVLKRSFRFGKPPSRGKAALKSLLQVARRRAAISRLLQSALLLLAIQSISPVWGQATFQVRHDHDPWGKCIGELSITPEGIEFASKKEKHSRNWKWTDIQSFDRLSESRFAVLTWDDQRLYLGLDRYFHFTILDGRPLSDEVMQLIRQNLPGTVTDRIPEPPDQIEYQVPVKHLHAFGGCEGVLYFGPEWIVFESDQPAHSRTWKRKAELESVWSLNRYQLELHVFEENRREFDKTRIFRFQLKRPLDRNYYEKLRKELRVEW